MTLWLFILAAWFLGSPLAFAKTCAQKGVCVLESSYDPESSIVNLEGEWQFYWRQILTPEEIKQGQGRLDGYYSLAEKWSRMNLPGQVTHAGSFATYALTLVVKKPSLISLHFPEISAASRIYLNHELVASYGVIGKDEKSEKAKQSQFFKTLPLETGEWLITVQMSNFSSQYNTGGTGFYLGKPEAISQQRVLFSLRDSFSFGVMFIMSFYHFFVWWIRKKGQESLYFALFTFGLAIRGLAVGSGEILDFLVPSAPFELGVKLEFVGAALGFAAVVYFIRALFPGEYARWFSNFVGAACALWLVLILLTKAIVYQKLLVPFQILMLITGIYQIWAIGIAFKRKRQGAGLFLGGFTIFFLAAVGDILASLFTWTLPPLAHYGTIVMVFSQALLLSQRFNAAFLRAEFAEKETRKLNEELEVKVEERTEQINTILANVSSGFLLIDAAGVLQPGFTRSCDRILGFPLKAGESLVGQLHLSASQRGVFVQAINQVFGDLLPEEVSLSQIPQRMSFQGKTLGLSVSPVRNKKNQSLSALLFTFWDVSELQEAEERIKKNEMILTILQDREGFKAFIKEFSIQLEKLRASIAEKDEKTTRSIIHTLKGNLASFRLVAEAAYVHHLEDLTTLEAMHVDELVALFEKTLLSHAELKGFSQQSEESFEIFQHELQLILQLIDSMPSDRVSRSLRSHVGNLMNRPIHAYLGPLSESVNHIARTLGKKAKLSLYGQDSRIDACFSSVLRNLIHAIRNSVDHGIEFPEERDGKPEIGRIELRFEEGSEQWLITCQDDGRGLDYSAIAAKASNLGLIPQQSMSTWSEGQLSQLILHPGFSTKDEISEVSGRGIGVSSLGKAVEEAGGKIEIQSVLGKGMTLIIQLPKSRAEHGDRSAA